MIWTGLGRRVPPSFSRESMLDVVALGPTRVPTSPVDLMRQELEEFIDRNRNNLSLPCDGRCSEHMDLIVLHCHKQFIGATDPEERRDGTTRTVPDTEEGVG